MAFNWAIQVCVILVSVNLPYTIPAAIEGESFNTSLPVCPNVRAIFNCTVCESNSDSTYWKVGNYSPCVLLHSFPGRDDHCGLNRTFVAELRPSEGDCYLSTFNITAFPSLSSSMVRCYVQVPGRARERTVGERRLEVIEAPPAPSFLNFSDVEPFQNFSNVILRWSEPSDYQYTGNITKYTITSNHTISTNGQNAITINYGTEGFIQKEFSIHLPVGTVAEFTVRADINACGGQLVGTESTALVIHVQVDEIAPGLSAEVTDYTISVTKDDEQIAQRQYQCMPTREWCSYSWEVTDQGAANSTISVAANNLVGRGKAINCTPGPIAHENNLFITTPPICNLSDLVESDTPTELSSHECHIAGHTNITAIEFTNGIVCLSGVTPESVAVYHCRNWYELYFPHEGHNPRTCGSDGQWNGSLPYCIAHPPTEKPVEGNDAYLNPGRKVRTVAPTNQQLVECGQTWIMLLPCAVVGLVYFVVAVWKAAKFGYNVRKGNLLNVCAAICLAIAILLSFIVALIIIGACYGGSGHQPVVHIEILSSAVVFGTIGCCIIFRGPCKFAFKKTGEPIAGKNEKGSAVKEDSGKRHEHTAVRVESDGLNASKMVRQRLPSK